MNNFPTFQFFDCAYRLSVHVSFSLSVSILSKQVGQIAQHNNLQFNFEQMNMGCIGGSVCILLRVANPSNFHFAQCHRTAFKYNNRCRLQRAEKAHTTSKYIIVNLRSLRDRAWQFQYFRLYESIWVIARQQPRSFFAFFLPLFRV